MRRSGPDGFHDHIGAGFVVSLPAAQIGEKRGVGVRRQLEDRVRCGKTDIGADRVAARARALNLAGRLIGILLSGSLAQYGGLSACLWGSAAMLGICLALTFLLPAGSEPRRVPVTG